MAGKQSFPQYFPDDLTKFKPRLDDVFVDAGAYNGDTLSVVFALTNQKGCSQYHAFEPDQDNADGLIDYMQSEQMQFVKVHRKGLWNSETTLKFDTTSTTQSTVTDSGTSQIEVVTTIDGLNIQPTFIKMDTEGAEYAALEGGAKTISKFKPRLAIAIYHNPEDLVDIPKLIKSFSTDYKFYIRIHSHMSEEMVLYAIAE